MTDTVTVASRAPMAIQIQEPLPDEFREKPGEAPLLRSATLNGSNHPGAKGGVGFTHGVEAEVFDLWHKAQVKAKSALAGMFSIVDPKEADKPVPLEYGFEPGLERMSENAENTSAAEEGSTVTHEGPVTSEEMAARSDTPNDDSPRGQPDILQVAHTQEPATALVDGHEAEHEHEHEEG